LAEAGQISLRLDVQVGEKGIEIGVHRSRETEDNETDDRYRDEPTHGMPLCGNRESPIPPRGRPVELGVPVQGCQGWVARQDEFLGQIRLWWRNNSHRAAGEPLSPRIGVPRLYYCAPEASRNRGTGSRANRAHDLAPPASRFPPQVARAASADGGAAPVSGAGRSYRLRTARSAVSTSAMRRRELADRRDEAGAGIPEARRIERPELEAEEDRVFRRPPSRAGTRMLVG